MTKLSGTEDGVSASQTGRRSRRAHRVGFAGLAACAAMLIAGCSVATLPSGPAPTAATSPGRAALPPVDEAALQAAVTAAAEQMMVPGAVVLVRTPQGTYRALVG